MKRFYLLLLILLGILLQIGGTIGFVKAQSIPSLVVATLVFVILEGAALRIYQQRPKAIGVSLILLTGVWTLFLWRLLASGKWMPAGLSLTLTSVVLLVGLWSWIKAR